MSKKYGKIKISPNYNIEDIEYLFEKDTFTEEEREEIAKVVYERLYDRYIRAIHYNNCKSVKSGFVMVAVSCILIEAIYSFEEGKDNTKRESRDSFKKFFERYGECFEGWQGGKGEEFYRNIRCGLLHQAEPLDGWVIRRDKKENGNSICFKTKTIQANLFVKSMEKTLEKLRDNILTFDIKAKNCVKKLKFIADKHKK